MVQLQFRKTNMRLEKEKRLFIVIVLILFLVSKMGALWEYCTIIVLDHSVYNLVTDRRPLLRPRDLSVRGAVSTPLQPPQPHYCHLLVVAGNEVLRFLPR